MRIDTFYKTESEISYTNRIFQEIYFQKSISKQEISKLLQLSLPTVGQSLKELYTLGIIQKNGYFESTGGRKAEVISVASKAKVAIGVSLLREFITITALDCMGSRSKKNMLHFL